MAEEIEVKVKVATDQAVTNVNKLGDAFEDTAKEAQIAQESFSKAGNGVQVEQSIAGLKQLKRELKGVAVGTDEFKRLYNEIDDLEDKLKSAKNTSADMIDSLANAGGPIGLLGQGINSVKVATQSFGGALKATGIGLLVALLGGLVSAFSENENAMKKIQPLFDGLKKITFGIFRAVEPLVDVFMDLAMKALPYVSDAVSMVYSGMMAYFTFLKEAGSGAMEILKGVFTLDGDAISAGINKVSGSFGKATETYKKSIKAFGEGEKELTEAEKDALEKRKEAQEKAQAKAEADRKKQLALRKEQLDALKSLEDKYANDILDIGAKTDEEKLALQKSRALAELDLIKLTEAEKAKARELIIQDFQKKEEALVQAHSEKILALNNKLEEDKKTLLAKTDEEKLKLNQERALKQLELDLVNDNASETERKIAKDLLQQNFDLQDAELKLAKDEKAKEEKLAMIELELEDETTSFDRKKQLILDRENLLLQDAKLTESQRVKIHKESVDAQMKIDKAKYQGQQELLKATSESLAMASDVLGKETTAGKAMAVASALINTYQGISAGVALGFPQAIPAVIAASVTGFKAVKSILSVKTPSGGGGGGGSMPSVPSIQAPTPTAIETPTATIPNANVIGTSGINQLATTLGGQAPIKAYVVGKDVSTQQSLDRNIVNTATLG